MVSQLLSPSQPKNASDILVLVILASLLYLLWRLPRNVSIPTFAVFFLFWRAMYNGGIGWLLYQQSNETRLVNWAKKYQIFQNPATGNQPHPAFYHFLKREFETKIPKDYNFDRAPIEYNTWLLFRRFVDLVLMCDFVCYCCFAWACGGRPVGEHVATTIGRWAAGIILFLFNLWVKLDAHRVVKDYAWYWGDFFYLIDQSLTFDGVFEMAPHPMYSVGYAGFYGISLMAASYRVLFISIVGHAAQFVFLYLVENPHIEKIYNSPPPRVRSNTATTLPDDLGNVAKDHDQPLEHLSPVLTPMQPPPSRVRNLIGIGNFDLHRSIDMFSILLQFYLYSFAILSPNTMLFQIFFVANAICWRLWYSVGIGLILTMQSSKKSWTRHFIKYGESSDEAWRQWKTVYHLSMIMCYASLLAAAYKMYTLPPDWQYGTVTLRHVLGTALVALQLWTVASIYDSLGEFGWFFGDFFFDETPKLTYNGIYRFLNNPERVLGLAGVWGFAIITWSKTIFFVALLSHALTLAFLQFVERPHMERRYGQSLRQTSGVSKTFSQSLPKPFRTWQGRADRVFEDTVELVEDFIDSARPRFAAGYETFVKDTKALFKQYPARLTITRIAPDMAGYDPKDYSLEIHGTRAANSDMTKASKRESDIVQSEADPFSTASETMRLEYGAPIKVKWTAPMQHGKRDWIGLYMIADNSSREVTRMPAQGRWIATAPGIFDSVRADDGIVATESRVMRDANGSDSARDACTGEVEFAGDKLWWSTGTFEFRYHHDGKHNVMAVSRPFEICITRFDDEAVLDSKPLRAIASNGGGDAATTTAEDNDNNNDSAMRAAIEAYLLPLVRNCFDRDPEIAPATVDEPYGSLVERDGKFARRVVYAVALMFGIDFAPSVVQSDNNVRNLAWRIASAKRVLAPYSMSVSAAGSARRRDGSGTPEGGD